MLTYETLQSALNAQPLFEAKTWQLSPEAWPLTRDQVEQLERIGVACLEFHQALETLYLRSASGRNLLRNKPLLAPWVADYLDRGKPAALAEHARDQRLRGVFPPVLRPDLLLTEDGFAMTELDSVPGGIGLTAFLNRLYEGGEAAVLGRDGLMVEEFYRSLAHLLPEKPNPLIALVVSEEAATYRPEMRWLAGVLQQQGRRVHCLSPQDLFPLGGALFFDVEGTPEKIDVIYRFFELFDLGNLPTAPYIFEAWAGGEVVVAPAMRHFQEEKLAFALFHHHRLQDFWAENLGSGARKLLQQLIPMSWVMDPAPLPPCAVLDGPRIAGRALADWSQLGLASQKERELIIKISGFHETAWGARSVVLGSDCSREDWQAGIARALEMAPTNLHILQEYRKPLRVQHPVYRQTGEGRAQLDASIEGGRLRLCPYFFNRDGSVKLAGALATFCPPDKKIIHGMQDAALLPCRVV